jgi:hypothetical protein
MHDITGSQGTNPIADGLGWAGPLGEAAKLFATGTSSVAKEVVKAAFQAAKEGATEGAKELAKDLAADLC